MAFTWLLIINIALTLTIIEACTPTEVPNSDYAAAGSITGSPGTVVRVTCDAGYYVNGGSTSYLDIECTTDTFQSMTCDGGWALFNVPPQTVLVGREVTINLGPVSRWGPNSKIHFRTGSTGCGQNDPTVQGRSVLLSLPESSVTTQSVDVTFPTAGDWSVCRCSNFRCAIGWAFEWTGAGGIITVEEGTCTPTEVPNSDYAAAGSITGSPGTVVRVTCDAGYYVNGGSASYLDIECTTDTFQSMTCDGGWAVFNVPPQTVPVGREVTINLGPVSRWGTNSKIWFKTGTLGCGGGGAGGQAFHLPLPESAATAESFNVTFPSLGDWSVCRCANYRCTPGWTFEWTGAGGPITVEEECPSGPFGAHDALPSPTLDGAGSGINSDGDFTLRVLVPTRYTGPALALLDKDDHEVPSLVFSPSNTQDGCSAVYEITHDFQSLVNDPLNVFTLIDRGSDVWFHGTVKISVVVETEEQEFAIELSNSDREGSFELDFHVVIPKTIDTTELGFSVDAPTGYAMFGVDYEVTFDCTGCAVPTGEDYVTFLNALIADFYANGVSSDASIIVTNMELGSLRISLQVRAETRALLDQIVTLINGLAISDFSGARAVITTLASTGSILQLSNVSPITALFGASSTIRQIERIVDPVSPTGRVSLTLLTSVSPGYKLELPEFNGPHNLTVAAAGTEGSSTGCALSTSGNTNRCEQFWNFEINSADCNTGGSFLAEFAFACNRDGAPCPDLSNQQLSISFDLPENAGACSVQTEQDLTLTATLVSYDNADRTPADVSDQFFFFNTIFLRAEVQTLNEVIAATSFAKLTLRYSNNTEVVLYDTSATPSLNPNVQEWNLANIVSAGTQLSDVDFLLGEDLFSQDPDTVESYTIFSTLAVDYTAANGVQARRLLDVEATSVDAKTHLSIGNPSTEGVGIPDRESDDESEGDIGAGAILKFVVGLVASSFALVVL